MTDRLKTALASLVTIAFSTALLAIAGWKVWLLAVAWVLITSTYAYSEGWDALVRSIKSAGTVDE
jgi:hypothetical protein